MDSTGDAIQHTSFVASNPSPLYNVAPRRAQKGRRIL